VKNILRIVIACILAITGVVGVVSVGVLATDAGELLKEMEAAEDPVKFFNELSAEDQNALLGHLDKETKVKKTSTITQGGDRSSTWVQVTENGWWRGYNVWRHTLRVNWSYDGTYVWGVINTDSYYGWGVRGYTWDRHCLYDYKYYNPARTSCDCWSNAHWEKKYYGFPYGHVYNTIGITVRGDGTFALW
jgi:hypothetical protein